MKKGSKKAKRKNEGKIKKILNKKVNYSFFYLSSIALFITLGYIHITITQIPDNYQEALTTFTYSRVHKPEIIINETIKHIETPEIVKGIYVTAYTAGAQSGARLYEIIRQTEINAIVIDVKMSTGSLAFTPNNVDLQPYYRKGYTPLNNIDELLDTLYEKNIYRIARLPIFQDPFYVEQHPEFAVKNNQTGKPWEDYKGVKWLDPASKDVWEYNVDIALELYNRGFDEVQMDYIRFPSDGNLNTIQYNIYNPEEKTKVETLTTFFQFLDEELRTKGLKTSVDLFGLTLWQHNFDLNIGQTLRSAVPYFDYVSPMVYPSHYPDGYLGYSNPAEHPYEVVFSNLEKGKELYEELGLENYTVRPWIQDFDIGAVYDKEMILKQTKACLDSKASGWLLWNARNVYTEEAWMKN